MITDNLSSHSSLETRTWLEAHPRFHHVFIPTGACWLNLQEGWWWLFRHDALAGQSFSNADEIEQATRVATAQLNHRAKPWIWGYLPPSPYCQGYVILLKRLDEEANGLKRLRIQASHLLFDVSDATEIEERQHTGIEHRSCMRSRALYERDRHLPAIRDVTPILESIFDRPLVASQCQHAGGIGPFWREAGDAIHERLADT